MRGICAGIVLYNPNIERLLENLASISKQVELVIIVDNNSDNISIVIDALSRFNNIKILKNSENYGIAKALNQICEEAQKKKYSWVLTLDQDSVLPVNMITSMSKYLNIERLGMLCPRFQNTVSLNQSSRELPKTEEIELCITSGSLLSVDAWKKSGKFDDWMFIDCVDYDMCLKLKKNRYKIIRLNEFILDHCVGSGEKIKVLGLFDVIVYNHSPLRNYYFVRNYIYMIRKYFDTIHPFKRICYVFWWEIKKILFERNKKLQIIAITKGIVDGFRKEIKSNQL